MKDAAVGTVFGVIGAAFAALVGENWRNAFVIGVGTGLIGGFVMPALETVLWRMQRKSILLAEAVDENKRLREAPIDTETIKLKGVEEWLAQQAASFPEPPPLPDAAFWRAREQAFMSVPGEVDAVWTYFPAHHRLEWSVTPNIDKSGDRRGVDRFLVEAKTAGEAIKRLTARPKKFPDARRTTAHEDEWLNSVAAMVKPLNDIDGGGFDIDYGQYDAGFVHELCRASRDACARLAVEGHTYL